MTAVTLTALTACGSGTGGDTATGPSGRPDLAAGDAAKCPPGAVCVFSEQNLGGAIAVLDALAAQPFRMLDLRRAGQFSDGSPINDNISSYVNNSDKFCLFTNNVQTGAANRGDLRASDGAAWDAGGDDGNNIVEVSPQRSGTFSGAFARFDNVFSSILCEPEGFIDRSTNAFVRPFVSPDGRKKGCPEDAVCLFSAIDYNGQMEVLPELVGSPFEILDFTGKTFKDGSRVDGAVSSVVNNSDRFCLFSTVKQTGAVEPANAITDNRTPWMTGPGVTVVNPGKASNVGTDPAANDTFLSAFCSRQEPRAIPTPTSSRD
ncbi:peptidase inhibitor family I36 protein [Phytohabitans flavus]|uniref:peptidase inhibitor family I36 protein n=1 Tax=Phytohabitans flavus TaxID=1076124 RepID=UPI0015679881|nr:peptidase inhibitor family I36 protein [Phytohabitans flavus]